jgi:HEAT repeat protein
VAAAEALGNIGSHHAIVPLEAALNDERRAVRHAAQEALDRLSTRVQE